MIVRAVGRNVLVVHRSEFVEESLDPLFASFLADESIREVVDYINKNDYTLGLYYFGRSQSEQNFVINNTRSGGVTVNDTMFHILQSRLPFGGVGQSGHGCFHGYEGFLNFSHLKSIYHQTSIDFILAMIRPPRSKAFSLLSKIMKKLG